MNWINALIAVIALVVSARTFLFARRHASIEELEDLRKEVLALKASLLTSEARVKQLLRENMALMRQLLHMDKAE